MKKIICLVVLMLISCSGLSVIDSDSLRSEFYSMRDLIVRNRDNIAEVRTVRVGRDGYFYIIDRRGVIIFHPQPVLAGRNFSRFEFVKTILSKETGCYKYTLDSKKYFVFFDRLNDSEFLVLSLPANSVSGKVRGFPVYR